MPDKRSMAERCEAVKASNKRRRDKGLTNPATWVYPEDRQRMMDYAARLRRLREATNRVPLETLLKPHRMRAAREEAQFKREQKAREEAEKAKEADSKPV